MCTIAAWVQQQLLEEDVRRLGLVSTHKIQDASPAHRPVCNRLVMDLFPEQRDYNRVFCRMRCSQASKPTINGYLHYSNATQS